MKTSALWIVAIVLCALGSAGAQTPYHDDALHWGLTIPPGWAMRSEQDIKDLNEEVHRRAPNKNFHFVAGLRVDPEGPAFPYILVQRNEIPLTGATYEDIEKVFGATDFNKIGREAVKSSADFIKSADFGKPRLDRATNRIFLDHTISDAEGRSLRGVSIMQLTPDGAIQLNFYTLAENFDKEIAKLDPFLASFKIDPGHEFVSGRGSRATAIGVKTGVGVLVGLLVAFVSIMRRKNAKPAQV